MHQSAQYERTMWGNMKKRKMNDPLNDNPVWGKAEFARARPAELVLRELFGTQKAEEMLKKRGGVIGHHNRSHRRV
jgi:hypothetical protein